MLLKNILHPLIFFILIKSLLCAMEVDMAYAMSTLAELETTAEEETRKKFEKCTIKEPLVVDEVVLPDWVAEDIKKLLIKIIAKNTVSDSAVYREHECALFVASKIPDISFGNYFDRICKYLDVSPGCFIIAIIYLDRIIQRYKDTTLNPYNIHRLFFFAFWIAQKFFEDHYYKNKYGADVAGLSLAEFNVLELEFLYLLHFSLFIDKKRHFDYYFKALEREHKKQAGACSSGDGAASSAAACSSQ